MNEKAIANLRTFWENAVSSDYQHFLCRDGFQVYYRELDSEGVRKVVTENGNILATGRIVSLDWDSKFFGHSCAKLEGLFFSKDDEPSHTRKRLIATLLDEEVARKAELLTCRVRADDFSLVQTLEAVGFRLVDVMVVFTKKLDDLVHSQQHGIAPKDDLSNVMSLLEKCIRDMQFGRIFADCHIPKEKAYEFYLQVSKYYLARGANTVILQYEGIDAGVAIGFLDETISVYLKRRYSYLWFISLLPDFKERKLGHELFSLFCQEFSRSCDWLEVGTQVHNYAATRVYEKGDCRVSSHLLTFHKWNR